MMDKKDKTTYLKLKKKLDTDTRNVYQKWKKYLITNNNKDKKEIIESIKTRNENLRQLLHFSTLKNIKTSYQKISFIDNKETAKLIVKDF